MRHSHKQPAAATRHSLHHCRTAALTATMPRSHTLSQEKRRVLILLISSILSLHCSSPAFASRTHASLFPSPAVLLSPLQLPSPLCSGMHAHIIGLRFCCVSCCSSIAPTSHRPGNPTVELFNGNPHTPLGACTASTAQHCMADVAHEEWAAAGSADAFPAAAAAAIAADTHTALVLHPNIGGSHSVAHLSNAVPLVQRSGLSTLRGGSYDAAALEELALQAFHSEGRMRTFCVLFQAVALVHAWHLRTGRVPAECHQEVQAHGQCAASHTSPSP